MTAGAFIKPPSRGTAQPSIMAVRCFSLLLIACSTAAFQLPVRPVRQPVSSSKSLRPSLVTLQADAEAVPAPQPKWVANINKISTFASILCAIDCTVFPILLAVLPLINVAGGGSAFLHKAAHAVALYFVAPVGGAAVISNALQHKRPLVFGWGLSGILCVLLANIHLPHAILGWHVPHALEHWLHARHELINVTGCALLLSSQWFSHKILEAAGKCCGHDHGHSHSH